MLAYFAAAVPGCTKAATLLKPNKGVTLLENLFALLLLRWEACCHMADIG